MNTVNNAKKLVCIVLLVVVSLLAGTAGNGMILPFTNITSMVKAEPPEISVAEDILEEETQSGVNASEETLPLDYIALLAKAEASNTVEYTAAYETGQDVNLNEVTLRNPSFEELKTFIRADLTSQNEFVLYEYECRHFATEVNNNAEAAGFRCAIVLICYERGQHAVVAFETTDRDLVYIEPQTDAVIRPEVGGSYQGMEIKEILTAW